MEEVELEDDGASDAVADVTKLAELDERVVDNVVATLSKVAPGAITEEVLHRELSGALSKIENDGAVVVPDSIGHRYSPTSAAQRIAAVVWHVYQLSVTADDEVSAVIDNFGSWLKLSGGLESSAWQIVRPRLLKLANIPNVFVAVKAEELRSAVQSSVSSVRVICDLRPIFTTNPENGPAGFTLLHTLELSVLRKDSESPIFVTMSDEVLTELNKQISRALTKRDALKSLIGERFGGSFVA